MDCIVIGKKRFLKMWYCGLIEARSETEEKRREEKGGRFLFDLLGNCGSDGFYVILIMWMGKIHIPFDFLVGKETEIREDCGPLNFLKINWKPRIEDSGYLELWCTILSSINCEKWRKRINEGTHTPPTPLHLPPLICPRLHRSILLQSPPLNTFLSTTQIYKLFS